MSTETIAGSVDKIAIPRPGHADLVGVTKYNFDDIRNSIERSSARETAARVAAGSVARKFLEYFGIYVGSFVESIGGIYPTMDYFSKLLQNNYSLKKSAVEILVKADNSSVRVLDDLQENKIIRKIKSIKKDGDTLGGTFITIATGVPVGLGSFMHFDRKLDADIAFNMMSINAVKGVEIGIGFKSAEFTGSQVHDEIILKETTFLRKTNFAGGIEGGISNGMPIVVRAAMKPISTLVKPLSSIDLSKMKKVKSRYERSDFTAVPACSVISESVLSWVIAKHFLEKFGGDSIEETGDNFNSYIKKSTERIKKGFKK
jgi:chorismate synthase